MKDKNTVVRVIVGLFAIFGFVFIIVGILWAVSADSFLKNAAEVSAVISEIESYRGSEGDTSHRVYVDYFYDGQEYKDVRLNEYSSGMYEGKEIQLMLDPDNPRRLMSNVGLYIGPIIFIGLGTVFAVVGVLSLIWTGRKAHNKKQLIASGQYIYATVESIECNKSFSVNGRHPFLIYCTYRDAYQDIIYRFKSDNIWTNPEYVIQPGNEIKVFVDRENYKNYHVDVEGILQGKIVDYT